MEKAGDILRILLKDTKLAKGETTSSVYTAWDRIAGEPLSHHTRVADIMGRQLVVEVEHPGWHQMLLFQKREILRKVQKEYPSLKLRGIRVRYQPKEKCSPAEWETARIQSAGSPKEDKDETPSLHHIADEKLKKSLEGLYRGIVRKKAHEGPEHGCG